jgi:hypothetical protein
LLSAFRLVFGAAFFVFLTDVLSSAASSFPQGLHTRPPSGPVLLYGVTVNRLLQMSQFSNCPGIGFAFLYIFAKASSSASLPEPSESCPFLDFLAFFFAAAFEVAFDFSSFRLRFFGFAGLRGSGRVASACAVATSPSVAGCAPSVAAGALPAP